MKRKNFIKLCVFGSIAFTFLVLFLIRYIPGVSEGWSRTISRVYLVVFGEISSFFPISIFELSIYAALIYAVTWLVLFIIHTAKKGIKESWSRILTLLIVIMSVVTTYTATAGMEYFRDSPDIPQDYRLVEDVQEYYELGKYFIGDLNECAEKMNYRDDGSSICPYTYDAVNDIMYREYDKLDSDYFATATVKAKPMYLTSWLYTELRITGVSFAPTGEPNVNIYNCPGDIPFTMAHEISHSKGIMREEDANLVALYICLNSENYYLRYSGYLNCLGSMFEFFKALNDASKYNELYYMVNPKVFKDNDYINNFWASHNLLDKISKWFNDLYLMISGGETTSAYIDHTSTEEHHEGGKTIYEIKQYSPFQAVLMNLYRQNKK